MPSAESGLELFYALPHTYVWGYLNTAAARLVLVLTLTALLSLNTFAQRRCYLF